MSAFESIGVLGAGAWGTALALNAQLAGRKVLLQAREPELVAALAAGAGNPLYLPGLKLPAIAATREPADLARSDVILAVAPAQFCRAVFSEIAGKLRPGTPVVLCAKGIEQGSLKLMTEVLAETLPDARAAVLSGPSFAADVARGLPTALTLACADEALGADLMAAIGRDTFRPYYSPDLVGAEIGGAVKNVLAIACGMVDGLGLGRSAHAALLTRGFAEMKRLAVAKGARPETLSGLSGLGDLVLTCSSPQSRNMSFGKAIGEGKSPEAILRRRTAVTEGAATAPAIADLAARHKVEMPICRAVAEILDRKITVNEAMEHLLTRPFREED